MPSEPGAPVKRSISLAGKAVALFCGGLLLVALLIGALEYRITREQVYNRMEDSAGNLLELLQNLVQEQPELLRDPAMGRILVRSGSRAAAVDRIMLLDGNGRLLAGSDSTLRPGSLVSGPAASQPGYNGGIYRLGGRRLLRLSEAFRPPQHHPGQAAPGGSAGTIAIDIDLSAIDRRVALDFGETMAIAILALLCLTVVLMVLTRKYFVEPLVQLAEAADRFGQTGSAPKVTLSTGDELQLLAEAFNRTVESRQREEEMLRAARAAAETANRTKSDFLANMSHEIRTPMNGVMGMLDLALDTDLSPEQREYLEIAKSSADSLLTVINDILDFSKIEAGRMELDPIPFRLGDSIADMTSALAHRAHKKGLELAVEIAPDVPDTLVGDVGRVRQVLVNLIGNAIKFTDRGEVAVRIGASPSAGEAVLLQVAVADTGIGVPAS